MILLRGTLAHFGITLKQFRLPAFFSLRVSSFHFRIAEIATSKILTLLHTGRSLHWLQRVQNTLRKISLWKNSFSSFKYNLFLKIYMYGHIFSLQVFAFTIVTMLNRPENTSVCVPVVQLPPLKSATNWKARPIRFVPASPVPLIFPHLSLTNG